MFAWERHLKVWQLIGAVLAIPAGIVGTYSAYRTYMSGGVSCGDLRNSIIVVLDRNLAAEAKQALLRRDIDKFDKNCGDEDPDAKVIFDAALAPAEAAPATKQAVAAATSAATPSAIFGLSRSGERRGWITYFRRKPDGTTEPNFDGAEQMTVRSLPELGTVLAARTMVPVWLNPPPVGQTNDSSALQGRIAAGSCVKLLARGPAGRPFWAEVAPEPCKPPG